MKRIDVLAIDDSPAILGLIGHLLPSDRYTVTTAEDGDQAVAQLQVRQFDVAIVDLRMPGPDGLEIVRFIKERHPDCVTIVLTGHATVEAAQELIRQGCDELLLKPLEEPTMLERAIDRCLEKRLLVSGVESLAQIDDTHRIMMDLMGNSAAELSHKCAHLMTRLRELDLAGKYPDVASLCISLRDGLASLGRLVRLNAG